MAIRNWNHIQFWTSIWLGDFALMLRFSSLYIICRNSNAKILEMKPKIKIVGNGPYHGEKAFGNRKR
jgi:hypothetical protein